MTTALSQPNKYETMEAAEIVNFLIREILPYFRKKARFAGLRQADIEYFVFHQAN